MKRHHRSRLMGVAVLALALTALPALAGPGAGQKASGVSIENGQISLSAEASGGGGTLILRGPDGIVQQHRFGAGQVFAAPLLDDGGAMLADGLYRFHLKPDVVSKGSRPEFGVFFVQNGQAVSRRGQRESLAARRGELSQAKATGGSALRGPDPQIGAADYVYVYDAGMDGLTSVYLGSDYGGYGGPLFDFRNNGFAGFVTYTPFIYAGYIGLNQTGNAFMGAYGYSTFFNTYYATIPMQIQPAAPSYSLWLTGAGLGIGTYAPTADFHLANVDGIGDTVFKFATATSSWNFGNTAASGVLTFNKSGTGGQEFTIRDRLDAIGATLDVQGSVKATNVVFPSSRALKTGFQAMDPRGVLNKVVDLPMTSWRFKHDKEDMVRFGPIAEDFHQAFGVGDGKTLSVLDVQGVSLAAIQGLNARLDEQDEALRAKEAELVDLRRINAVLEERLAAIETRLAEGSP